jgi:protein-export membrane protein SecD
MSEPSGSSGCLTPILMLLAAIFGSFMAAFSSASSLSIAPTDIVTHVSLAPVGSFTSDELNQAAVVIQKRLNGLGLSTATVNVSGNTSIEVGLPQIENLDDVLKTLSARGLLEFVDFSDVPNTGEWTDREILTTGQGEHPISETAEKNPVTNQAFETVLTGDGVKSATAESNEQFGGQWQVTIKFSDEAAKVLGDYTRAHLGKALAIVLDGKVLSVPIIQAEISSQAVIAGNFTEEDVKRLAVQLAGGALPFEMHARAISVLRGDFGMSISTATPSP